MASAGSFVTWKTVPPLPNVLQGEDLSLPLWHGDPQTMLSAPEPPLSSTEAPPHTPGLTLAMAQASKTRLWVPLLLKLAIIALLVFQVSVFGEVFFLCSYLQDTSVFLSLSLSLSCLCDQGSLPSAAPVWFFSPPNHLSTLLPYIMWPRLSL